MSELVCSHCGAAGLPLSFYTTHAVYVGGFPVRQGALLCFGGRELLHRAYRRRRPSAGASQP